MDAVQVIWEFWWLCLLLIPAYLIYYRIKRGEGIMNFGFDEAKLIFVFIVAVLMIYLFQRFIFTDHWYLIFFICIFLPVFSVFIYLLLMKDNVLIIESTMDCEIFYDLKLLDKRIAEQTRCRAFVLDRDAYNEIRHVGDIEYPYWNGGDGVKFTDYFDSKNGVMYHPTVGLLHNVSFFIAKSFWLKMKEDIPDLMRQNALLTWLSPYKTAFQQTKLADNFFMRLTNLERQWEDTPFAFPDDIRKLWEHEIEQKRQDREASEIKIPLETPDNDKTGDNPESGKGGAES